MRQAFQLAIDIFCFRILRIGDGESHMIGGQ